jgi:hypothetical protein
MSVLRLLCAVLALALVGVAVFLLRDDLPRHMAGHVVLLDLVGILSVFAVPAAWRRSLVQRIDAAADSGSIAGLGATALRSPIVLLAVWTAVVSALMTPWGHALATSGYGPIIEPIILVLIGIALWRATFDQHAVRPLPGALVHGGLEWWGRHVFVMVGRIAILPAIFAMWFAPVGAFDASADQQMQAASIVLGAELLVFGCAALLFLFLFLRSDIGVETNQLAPGSR